MIFKGLISIHTLAFLTISFFTSNQAVARDTSLLAGKYKLSLTVLDTDIRYSVNLDLEVSDKGVGIDATMAASPERGWGLEGMRERAESVSGQLHISSPAGGGTIVEVTVPINEFSISAVEEKPDEHHPVDVS